MDVELDELAMDELSILLRQDSTSYQLMLAIAEEMVDRYDGPT